MKTKVVDADKKLFLSLVTGQLYTVELDEIKNLDNQQLPLVQYPKASCNKCFGRGYTGRNAKNNELILCRSCMKNCIDIKLLSKEIASESIKKTNG